MQAAPNSLKSTIEGYHLSSRAKCRRVTPLHPASRLPVLTTTRPACHRSVFSPTIVLSRSSAMKVNVLRKRPHLPALSRSHDSALHIGPEVSRKYSIVINDRTPTSAIACDGLRANTSILIHYKPAPCLLGMELVCSAIPWLPIFALIICRSRFLVQYPSSHSISYILRVALQLHEMSKLIFGIIFGFPARVHGNVIG
jgi:hypothetical protein